MNVNTWDILQTVFMVWIIFGAFIASFVFMAIIETKQTKQKVLLIVGTVVGTVVIWTVLIMVGGFLYYKNMETKCMYDPGFQGPCIEKNLS